MPILPALGFSAHWPPLFSRNACLPGTNANTVGMAKVQQWGKSVVPGQLVSGKTILLFIEISVYWLINKADGQSLSCSEADTQDKYLSISTDELR